MVSVIIPVHNAAQYLEQCIECILYQTYKDIEIIVVDDGSTDNSAEIAARFPVKLIQQENKGVSAARNKGMETAAGDYLHFMDADDFVDLGFYEKMVTAIESVNADIACSEVYQERYPELSLRIKDKLLLSHAEDKMVATNLGNQAMCFKFLYRKDFLKKINLQFDTTVHIAEDLLFNIQVLFLCRHMVTVPDAVYYYKMRPGSALNTKGKEREKFRKMTLGKVHAFVEQYQRTHNLYAVAAARMQYYYYRILGLRILKKSVQDIGTVRWYLFGILIIKINKENE